MSILVLQTLAHESRATGGCTQQETAAALIAKSPDHITNPLEAEHRIENEEGDHIHTLVGIGRTGGGKGGHGTGLGDAFLQDLAVFCFTII